MHQGISLLYIWVRNNYLTNLGIYLLPVASGWFLAIDRAAVRWLKIKNSDYSQKEGRASFSIG